MKSKFAIGILLTAYLFGGGEARSIELDREGLTVENPAHGRQIRELENCMFVPELTIGVEDGADEYLFGRVADIAVSTSGAIHVLDQSYRRIQVFDSTGQYLRTIGRQGEGPCEFAYPTALDIDEDGRIYLVEQARVIVYTPDGSCLSQFDHGIVGGGLPKSIVAAKNGQIVITCYDVFGEEVIHVYDRDGTRTISFGEPFQKGQESDVRSQIMAAGGRVVAGSDNTLWYTQMLPYEIRQYNMGGELLMTIHRENDFMRIPELVDVNGGKRLTPAPYAASLLFAPHDELLNVVRCRDDDGVVSGTVVDVFDADGKLQYSEEIAGDVSILEVDNHSRFYLVDVREFPQVIRTTAGFRRTSSQ